MEDKIDGIFYPSENPGAHERHLIRRSNNVLFGARQTEVDSDSLQQNQKKDHDILQQFMSDFRDLMTKAIELKPNEDSEVILEVKDGLDKLYAASVSVADDQVKVQESIKKLLAVIMQSVGVNSILVTLPKNIQLTGVALDHSIFGAIASIFILNCLSVTSFLIPPILIKVMVTVDGVFKDWVYEKLLIPVSKVDVPLPSTEYILSLE